jgi:tetratricopeptide (TPR) repeat protein
MRFSLLIILLFLSGLAQSQSKESARELFDDGEYFFHREEYSEAAYYYKKLIGKDPENSNFNFKLGECYMNIPGKEELAIPFFEKATQNTIEKKKYKIRDFEENNAPLHAWFYLGNVYRMAGRLDDALNSYNTFVNSPFYYGNYNIRRDNP